jgi:hypothetical protein
MRKLEEALRNTWADQSHILFSEEAGEITPRRVRELMRGFLESEPADELVIAKFWRPLVASQKDAALSAAFPDGTPLTRA